MKSLKELYAEWREGSKHKLVKEVGEQGYVIEPEVREDFSHFAGLNQTIPYDEIVELEREYTK